MRVYAACLDLLSVRVCDCEVPVNQILAWKADLQLWVIHQSFSADCTKLILFPSGCFCVMLYQIQPVNFFSACTVPMWLLHSLSIPVNVSQVVSHSRDNADTQY